MLDDLEKIEWHKLTHAYGSAGDVPGLIRDLTASDPETRDRARYELYGNIWHQGTVYQATSFAVPFLIELLEEESIEAKDGILLLLADIAHGESYLDVHGHSSFYDAERDTAAFKEKLAQELEWVHQAHATVRDGIEVYLDLLGQADPKVRMCAAYALACFRECGDISIPRLRARLEQEEDECAKASLLLSLGILLEETAESLAFFERILKTEKRWPPRLAAAMALARLAREKTPKEAVAVLVEAIRNPASIKKLDPWEAVASPSGSDVTMQDVVPQVARQLSPALVEDSELLNWYVCSALHLIEWQERKRPTFGE